MVIRSLSLDLLYLLLFASSVNAAPRSSFIEPPLNPALIYRDLWASNNADTTLPLNLSSLENNASLSTLDVTDRPPVCSGKDFGKIIPAESCWDALNKMKHLQGYLSFAWPGYGIPADVNLPRRYSSGESRV